MISSYWEPLEFAFQESPGEWLRAVDTGLASPDDVSEPGSEPRVPSSTYVLGARSVAIFLRPRQGPEA